MLADADDTAKALLCLSRLGRSADCSGMIKAFETGSHFKTYDFEVSESFSANCNVLIALLHSGDPSRHLGQIHKALDYLCQAWYDGKWADKWVRTVPLQA